MIRISNLSKSYPGAAGPVPAVRGLSLAVAEGEFVSLLGPSGCGKTSTLRCIAGLEDAEEGEIEVDGRLFFSAARRIALPPNRRDIGMVFQSYAIWPHMTVFENAAFPLRVARRPGKESAIRDRVMAVLASVGLQAFASRQATQLSGGQQQRLALARALVTEPRVLLLDEPLSNLDARLRDQMRGELRGLQRDLGVTTVYVTHDQTEALSMSSRVVVMNQGEIVQEGAPRDIYLNPRTRFVADFLGAANFLAGIWQDGADGMGQALTACGSLCGRAVGPIGDGEPVLFTVRPEDLVICAHPSMASGEVPAQIKSITFLGEQVDIELDLGAAILRARQQAHLPFREGDRVFVVFPEQFCVAIPAGPRETTPS